jgi:hypothetical protein
MRKPVLVLVGLLLFFAQVLQAQNVEVSGTVRDEKGNPIVGATVQERKTRKGTTTDEKGSFNLSVPKGSIIDVSFIGFIYCCQQ